MNSKQKRGFSLSKFQLQLEKVQVSLGGQPQLKLKKDHSNPIVFRDTTSALNNPIKKQKKILEKCKLNLQSKISRQNLEQVQSHFQKWSTDYNFQKNNLISRQQKQYQTQPIYKPSNIYNQKFNQISQQDKFIQQCSKLYGKKFKESQLEQLIEEINIRDSVYDVIEENFKQNNQINKQKIVEKLNQTLIQYKLMIQILQQFKKNSKLEIKDLNELYYFLKDG